MTPFSDSKTSKRKGRGEPMVWFSAMWLGFGMLMIIVLLSIIVKNGLTSFWPSPVVQVELVENSEAGLKNSSTLAGDVRKEQVRTTAGESGEDVHEIQLFIGNREAYNTAFRFVMESDIAEKSFPKGIMRAERLEYGDMIGYPVRLELSGGETISATDEKFAATFSKIVKEGNHRRDEIEHIEKDLIGKINRSMEAIKMKRPRSEGDEALNKELDQKQAELQAEYEELAKEAKEMRDLQTVNTLFYTIPTGEERSIGTGNLIDYYYPNQLNVFQRVGRFFARIGHFVTEDPREANTEGGIFPAIFGTFVMTILMSIVVVPFGVLAAIYLREYAKQGPIVRAVRIAVNNLAGVPSIVFGVFGLGFFVYFMGGSIDSLLFSDRLPTPTFGTGGVLWAALTLALMTVPVVIVSTEEALVAVPRGVREASLAAGASKWQTIQRIVLPASLPGIITGLILAMARGAGEVAPLMLVGVVKLAPTLPLDTIAPFIHMERKFMHLGFHIYDLGFQSPDSEAAKPMVFATTLLLIGLVIALNGFAILIRERLRRKYKTGAF
ncbi:phosphate ABC transporter permease PstA [Verrucomicrobiales bacterium BCK34]|nr:phosphate ABC transporter permease PstA [Verrucomicrobiales bacterium BCK34]